MRKKNSGQRVGDARGKTSDEGVMVVRVLKGRRKIRVMQEEEGENQMLSERGIVS